MKKHSILLIPLQIVMLWKFLEKTMDKYTISIMAIKGWQDIWAKNYNDLHLRVTFEYLIQSELLWLNQDFKDFVAKNDEIGKFGHSKELKIDQLVSWTFEIGQNGNFCH